MNPIVTLDNGFLRRVQSMPVGQYPEIFQHESSNKGQGLKSFSNMTAQEVESEVMGRCEIYPG